MVLWIQFVACIGIILISGTYLSKYGDVIAEKTGLGRTWVGVILMASVTSLPELVTGISSVAIFNVPDIMAFGNIFESNLFNILILAIDDLFYTKGPILLHVSVNHLVSSSAAIAMTGIAVLGLTYE